MPTTTIDSVAQMIVSGVAAATALDKLKATYTTPGSLNSAMSRVRAAILDSGHRCAEYDDSELRKLGDATVNATVNAFLALPPREQYQIQRAHASRTTSWSPRAEAALARLRILPPALDAFRLSDRDTLALKRKREAAVVAKNESLLVVPDAAALLGAAAAALQAATPRDSYATVLLPLLLVSGRRLSEIANGRSTFTPLPHEHTCMFDGQLKKKGTAKPYVIPILVPFRLFANGLRVLREKQRGESLTNAQAKNRYQGNLQRDLSHGALRGMPQQCHIHDLRATYMVAVYELFVSPWTFSRTAMACLGHESMHESLCYQSVRLEGISNLRGSLGSLHLKAE